MFGKVRQHRRSSATTLGALAVVVALMAVVAGGAQAAKPGNSENAKACQKGGWEDLARSEDFSGFSSEEECVSYGAQGGTLVNPPPCQQQLADAGLTAPANANYILGTPGDDDFSGSLTLGNDVICGFAGNDRAFGVLDIDDIFLGGDGNDFLDTLLGGTFNGGDGDDFLFDLVGGTFNGGAGDDRVDFLQVFGTFNGEGGCDTVGFEGGTFNQGEPCPS